VVTRFVLPAYVIAGLLPAVPVAHLVICSFPLPDVSATPFHWYRYLPYGLPPACTRCLPPCALPLQPALLPPAVLRSLWVADCTCLCRLLVAAILCAVMPPFTFTLQLPRIAPHCYRHYYVTFTPVCVLPRLLPSLLVSPPDPLPVLRWGCHLPTRIDSLPPFITCVCVCDYITGCLNSTARR